MSQQQPSRPQPQQESIKYDADMAPQDTSMMESAENRITQKGGAAAASQSASGLSDLSNVVAGGDRDVEITEIELPGKRLITEFIGGQVIQQHSQPVPLAPVSSYERGNITIGEALEATALTSGQRPVDYSDAAAIQAAEVRATGRTNIVPGGVAAAAQSAATRNARTARDEDKTKLREVLSDATAKLPSDKPVTRKDAEGVISAEVRNDPNLATHPGGVAASLAAAARLNQSK